MSNLEKLKAEILGLPEKWRLMAAAAYEVAGWEAVMWAPGSTGKHQAWEGGLIEHILEVLQISQGLLELDSNKSADKDVVTTGILLHDIGKVRSYRKAGGSNAARPYTYTKAESESHHIVLGIEILVEARIRAEDKLKAAGFTEEDWAILRHILVSHHGKREYGALREPQNIEAMIVHLADQASAMCAGIRNKS